LKLTATQSCPCAAHVVDQCTPPVGSKAHARLIAGAHAAAKAAAAAVIAKGGSIHEANAAAAAAHASHIAAHAAGAVAEHKAYSAVIAAGGTEAQAQHAAAVAHADHMVKHAKAIAKIHGVGSVEHTNALKAAEAASRAIAKTASIGHTSQINHFDTGVDEVTPCLISPPLCHNGKCVDKQAHHYVCICDHGWAGNNCEVPLTAAAYGSITQLAFKLPFFSFNVPFEAVSNKHLDSAIFEAQVKQDLAKAFGTTTDRFEVKGLSPSADDKYTVLTMTVTPATRHGDITVSQIQTKMKAWVFPTLHPQLARGIATRHLFVPGSAAAVMRFKSKLPKAPEVSPKQLNKKGTTESSAPRSIASFLAICLPILMLAFW
jgi:hypothetical protein